MSLEARDSERPQPSERPRRTQLERRTGTRNVLLQATVACLVEHGYRGTTTLEVERAAGVSRGARIHHFATKASLLAGAVDHLYTQIAACYDQAFGRLPSAANQLSDLQRFRAGLRLLWSIYRSPDYTAVLELTVAARTDEELRTHLRQVGVHHRKLARDAAATHFPRLDGLRAAALIEAIHVSLSGLLLQHHVNEGAQAEWVDEIVLGMLDTIAAMHLDDRPSICPPV
jgi:AcrR family transcriptional regulator